MLKKEEVLAQSHAAMNQWEPAWREHAKKNGELRASTGTSQVDVIYSGVGKTCVLVGMGNSIERDMETLKTMDREAVDIGIVDKCLGKFIDHNCRPNFVMLADAGVDYNRWCKP